MAVRLALTDRFFYYFLVWNLVLALVPYGISVAIFRISKHQQGRLGNIGLVALSLAWLIFYPNAPYIFTDFIHIVNRTFVRSSTDLLDKETLLWFDLVLCSAFAYMGHAAGLLSIDLVLRSFQGFLPATLARVLVGTGRRHSQALVSILAALCGSTAGNSFPTLSQPYASCCPMSLTVPLILLSAAFSSFIFITYLAHHITRRKY
ncbi:hypothetical protein MASR2M78_09530 [Treponema sp.]